MVEGRLPGDRIDRPARVNKLVVEIAERALEFADVRGRVRNRDRTQELLAKDDSVLLTRRVTDTYFQTRSSLTARSPGLRVSNYGLT